MAVTTSNLSQLENFTLLAPELILVITAVFILLIDLGLPQRVNYNMMGGLSLLSVLLSLSFIGWQLYQRLHVGDNAHIWELFNQSYRVDNFSLLIKIICLVGTAFIILLSIGYLQNKEIKQRSEFYYLLLLATLGVMMMSSSDDLITLYISIELVSITSYILVGMKKNNRKSTEGAFKYIILGSVASAFILYGMSFLYGMTGSTQLTEVAWGLLQQTAAYEPLIYVSGLLMFVGLGIKIAAVPFHAWAPDVYEGAPTPITTFLAVVAKGATLALLLRIFYNVYVNFALQQQWHIYDDLSTILLILAAVSMIMGTTMALKQRNMKRLFALSGIVNTGYLLVPIGLNMFSRSIPHLYFSQFSYYLLAYLLTTIGAFAVHIVVSRCAKHDEISGYAGLYYRSPWLAVAMTILLLSLAGLPITAGFMGKLYIVLAAIIAKTLWIALFIMLTSMVSFYFYFRIIVQMYMRASNDNKIYLNRATGCVIFSCVVAVFLLGVFPHIAIHFMQRLI